MNSENEIAIYNNYFFSKKPSETNKPINFDAKEEYNQYFSLPIHQKKGQIPIFKYFEGQGYKIFIGVPFQITFQDITKQLISKEKNLISNSKNDSLSYINYIKNKQWITESVLRVGDSSTIYLATLQDSAHYANNKKIFDADSVRQRFYKK
ncbi:hypothetical protein [Bernardetia litoralis]|uniref:hypothetical protein n=1 Tax=Bernardetia litoralis TaxID=999 RepID=UPI0012FE3AA3|nr:hypothetical protein [Bernardetia litoralis]